MYAWYMYSLKEYYTYTCYKQYTEVRRLSWRIAKSIKADQKKWTKDTGEVIESILEKKKAPNEGLLMSSYFLFIIIPRRFGIIISASNIIFLGKAFQRTYYTESIL